MSKGLPREQRKDIAHHLAEPHGGMVRKVRLRAVGITDSQMRAEIRAGRWFSCVDGHDKLPGDGHEAARWRT